jgi:mannose-6-phosphate isomerase
MASPSVFKIIPTTQQYDWGKIGSNAKVALFAAASSLPGFSVNESLPYAEVCYHDHSGVTINSFFLILVMDGHAP